MSDIFISTSLAAPNFGGTLWRSSCEITRVKLLRAYYSRIILFVNIIFNVHFQHANAVSIT
jgi:hypothetical protein